MVNNRLNISFKALQAEIDPPGRVDFSTIPLIRFVKFTAT
jgi:hypothetical protein